MGQTGDLGPGWWRVLKSVWSPFTLSFQVHCGSDTDAQGCQAGPQCCLHSHMSMFPSVNVLKEMMGPFSLITFTYIHLGSVQIRMSGRKENDAHSCLTTFLHDTPVSHAHLCHAGVCGCKFLSSWLCSYSNRFCI